MITGTSSSKALDLVTLITMFKGCIGIENIHPTKGGVFRRKSRKDRRPTLPIESPLVFYPKYFFETIWKFCRWTVIIIRMRLLSKKVLNDY